MASSGGSDSAALQDMHSQHLAAQQLPAAQVQSFVTPAMWQESVASVYEGGLKRAWDYDSHMSMKRH